jgi:hypothetical protein
VNALTGCHGAAICRVHADQLLGTEDVTTSTSPEDGPRTKIPRADVSVGHLRIKRGLQRARITTDPKLGDLLHGSWRREPKVAAENGHVTLTYPRFRSVPWGTDEIILNATVPWDISIEGGVHRVGVDLRGLLLRSLSIDGSASRLALVLGKPDRDVQVDLKAADRVTIRRPQETQVRVRLAKGADRVVVDDQTYGAIGGETILKTGPVVRNAYHLNVIGARRLRVTTL